MAKDKYDLPDFPDDDEFAPDLLEEAHAVLFFQYDRLFPGIDSTLQAYIDAVQSAHGDEKDEAVEEAGIELVRAIALQDPELLKNPLNPERQSQAAKAAQEAVHSIFDIIQETSVPEASEEESAAFTNPDATSFDTMMEKAAEAIDEIAETQKSRAARKQLRQLAARYGNGQSAEEAMPGTEDHAQDEGGTVIASFLHIIEQDALAEGDSRLKKPARATVNALREQLREEVTAALDDNSVLASRVVAKIEKAAREAATGLDGGRY